MIESTGNSWAVHTHPSSHWDLNWAWPSMSLVSWGYRIPTMQKSMLTMTTKVPWPPKVTFFITRDDLSNPNAKIPAPSYAVNEAWQTDATVSVDAELAEISSGPAGDVLRYRRPVSAASGWGVPWDSGPKGTPGYGPMVWQIGTNLGNRYAIQHHLVPATIGFELELDSRDDAYVDGISWFVYTYSALIPREAWLQIGTVAGEKIHYNWVYSWPLPQHDAIVNEGMKSSISAYGFIYCAPEAYNRGLHNARRLPAQPVFADPLRGHKVGSDGAVFTVANVQPLTIALPTGQTLNVATPSASSININWPADGIPVKNALAGGVTTNLKVDLAAQSSTSGIKVRTAAPETVAVATDTPLQIEGAVEGKVGGQKLDVCVFNGSSAIAISGDVLVEGGFLDSVTEVVKAKVENTASGILDVRTIGDVTVKNATSGNFLAQISGGLVGVTTTTPILVTNREGTVLTPLELTAPAVVTNRSGTVLRELTLTAPADVKLAEGDILRSMLEGDGIKIDSNPAITVRMDSNDPLPVEVTGRVSVYQDDRAANFRVTDGSYIGSTV